MPALTKAQKKQAQAAEDSFNRTYAAQFGEERWQQSLYPALAAPTRYATLTNGFAVTDLVDAATAVFSPEQVAKLQAIAFPTTTTTTTTTAAATTAEAEAEATSDPPEKSPKSLIKAYQWDVSEAEATFPQPQPETSSSGTGLMTHWNLDAASLLAVSVLGVKPGDKILDLCAAPGGKSVALSQFLRPEDYNNSSSASPSPSLKGGCLHSNEVNPARNKRLATNLQAYLPTSFFATGEVKILKLDGAEPSSSSSTSSSLLQTLPLGPGGYDKVLLDAPCSSERHVIHAHAKAKQGGRGAAEEMTTWRSGQSKKMAKVQVALLMTALKAVCVGGRVLYATCSLSNDENDGVVEKAVELVQKERKKSGVKWDFVVRSGELGARGVEGWAEATRYGWLVLPDHPSGGRWGPLFFALLEKVER